MRKVSVCLLSIVLCLCLFMFVGCDPKSTDNKAINIEDCEVGYKVAVYPDFPFDYQVQLDEESYIVHVESIEVTLTEKNTIQKGEVVSGMFFPYTFTVIAKATTDVSLANKEAVIRLAYGNTSRIIRTNVQNNGQIEWETTWNISLIPNVSFSEILINGNTLL